MASLYLNLGIALSLIYWASCQDNITLDLNLSVCSSMNYRLLSHSVQNEHQCLLLEKIAQDLEDERMQRETMINDIFMQLDAVNEKLNQMGTRMTQTQNLNDAEATLSYSPMLPSVPLIRECNELNTNGIHISGIYPIKLPNQKILNVYCDMKTERGGWTMIQRRIDGGLNFTRNWNDYAFGFGNTNSEYWIGNEYLHQMTTSNNFTLRIDLWDWEGDTAYAEYRIFNVDNEADGYRLHVSGFQGTAGDSLTYNNNMKFSTYDKDNDLWQHSCAAKDEAGWWYKACGYCNLNGIYRQNGTISISPDGLIKGIIWYYWNFRYGYSLKRVEMKIKPTLAITIERELLETLDRQANRQNEVLTTTSAPSTTQRRRNNRRQRNRRRNRNRNRNR